VNVSFLQELLGSIADRGRALLPRSLFGAGAEADVEELARVLISGRGEASGVAIASELLDRHAQLDEEDRLTFFRFLATELKPDASRVAEAAQAYLDDPTDVALARLQKALDSPRLEFFRRLNLAPGATAQIVAMRRDLLEAPLDDDPALAAVDADLRRLLYSWFNRGFLVLRRIDWNTPAAILEKIIRYEAVHEIKSWDDLRRRLDPADRRCFAFFHPSLVDEPLVFVEVALTRDVPEAINEVLDEAQGDAPGSAPTTAVFYSISNCQDGLRGISFGNFLLKQVAEELAREEPRLKTFVTLSPVPGFADWLRGAAAAPGEAGVPDQVGAQARALLGELQRAQKRSASACRLLFPRGQAPRRQARRSGRPLPSRQRGAARAPELDGRSVREEHGRSLRAHGQLSIRFEGDREEPRGLRQRGHDHGLARRTQPVEAAGQGQDTCGLDGCGASGAAAAAPRQERVLNGLCPPVRTGPCHRS